MSTIQHILVIPAALLAMIAMSTSLAAQCDSNGSSSFRYPGGCQGCGNGAVGAGLGNVFQHFQDNFDTFKADYRINRARSSAWPQPFSCWDREHYHAIFNQQFATGNQVAHTLTAEYFDPETNKLNRAGEMKVAWIMQNAPRNDKQIYVHQDGTAPTAERRMASIRAFTGRYYAHLGNATVATSQIRPNQIPAYFQREYLRAYTEEQPAPIIPVDVGSSISSTISN